MKKHIIRLSNEAISDIENLYNYIAYVLLEPSIAIKYYEGVLDAINHLSIYGHSIAVSQRQYIQESYGPEARLITYKKMGIVYNVIQEIIFVRRVLPGSLIK